ncbi:MAG: MraY family glycosyltransferase [Janthinobacterium lividum]
MFPSLLDARLLAAPFLCCFVLCALVLWGLLRSGWAWLLATDMPNHRSLHTHPTPRVGGLGLVPALVVGIGVFAPQLVVLALCALGLCAMCLIDDRRGLSARVRFVAQIGATVLACACYPMPQVAWWFWPIIVLAIVWLTNLYNFMDGADGLAGGMTLIGFTAYAIAAYSAAPGLGLGAIGIAGAAGGFLIFNRTPAKLFLGDGGSIPLGFLAGSLGLIGWSAHIWHPWFPLMVFSPFIADASVTLARRLLRGERFWEAHREHYYQRMIRMKGDHAGTIRIWYAFMLMGAWIALAMQALALRMSAWALVLGVGWLLTLLAFGLLIDRHWAKFDQTDGQS